MSEQFQNSLQNAILYQPHHSSGEKWRRIAFPLRALNKEWQESVQALQIVTQAPLEICFAALFSSVNHAAQSLVNIKLPHGQVKPVSCFFISIADSGERKTSADDIALKATAQYQKGLNSTRSYRRKPRRGSFVRIEIKGDDMFFF